MRSARPANVYIIALSTIESSCGHNRSGRQLLCGDMNISERIHAPFFRGVQDFYTDKVPLLVVIENHAIGDFLAFLNPCQRQFQVQGIRFPIHAY